MSDVQMPSADAGGEARRTSRRDFLRLASVSGAALLLPAFASACTSEKPTDPRRVAQIDLATDDGLLDFAFVAAQFSYQIYQTSRFYTPYAGVTALEASTLQTLANHASSYRVLFYRTNGARITEGLRFQFPSLDFSSRASFYPFALEYEEKLAGAYAWAIAHASDADTATLLGKLASVSGRHVATLRDLADIAAGNAATSARTSFANDDAVSPATGMQVMVSPADLLAFIRPYIASPLSVRGA